MKDGQVELIPRQNTNGTISSSVHAILSIRIHILTSLTKSIPKREALCQSPGITDAGANIIE